VLKISDNPFIKHKLLNNSTNYDHYFITVFLYKMLITKIIFRVFYKSFLNLLLKKVILFIPDSADLQSLHLYPN